MLRLSVLVFALAALVHPVSASAQELAGRWEATRETPRGEMVQTLILQQEEGVWTGTLSLMRQEMEIKEVKVEGNQVTFTMELAGRGRGAQAPRTITQTFRGTLEGDEIKGEMEGPRGPMPLVFKRVKGS